MNEPIDLGGIHEARDRAVAASVCLDPPIGCGLIATAFRDALSASEYRITGMCQSCQDKMYAYGQEIEGEYLPLGQEPPF